MISDLIVASHSKFLQQQQLSNINHEISSIMGRYLLKYHGSLQIHFVGCSHQDVTEVDLQANEVPHSTDVEPPVSPTQGDDISSVADVNLLTIKINGSGQFEVQRGKEIYFRFTLYQENSRQFVNETIIDCSELVVDKVYDYEVNATSLSYENQECIIRFSARYTWYEKRLYDLETQRQELEKEIVNSLTAEIKDHHKPEESATFAKTKEQNSVEPIRKDIGIDIDKKSPILNNINIQFRKQLIFHFILFSVGQILPYSLFNLSMIAAMCWNKKFINIMFNEKINKS